MRSSSWRWKTGRLFQAAAGLSTLFDMYTKFIEMLLFLGGHESAHIFIQITGETICLLSDPAEFVRDTVKFEHGTYRLGAAFPPVEPSVLLLQPVHHLLERVVQGLLAEGSLLETVVSSGKGVGRGRGVRFRSLATFPLTPCPQVQLLAQQAHCLCFWSRPTGARVRPANLKLEAPRTKRRSHLHPRLTIPYRLWTQLLATGSIRKESV